MAIMRAHYSVPDFIYTKPPCRPASQLRGKRLLPPSLQHCSHLLHPMHTFVDSTLQSFNTVFFSHLLMNFRLPHSLTFFIYCNSFPVPLQTCLGIPLNFVRAKGRFCRQACCLQVFRPNLKRYSLRRARGPTWS